MLSERCKWATGARVVCAINSLHRCHMVGKCIIQIRNHNYLSSMHQTLSVGNVYLTLCNRDNSSCLSHRCISCHIVVDQYYPESKLSILQLSFCNLPTFQRFVHSTLAKRWSSLVDIMCNLLATNFLLRGPCQEDA